MIQYVYVCNDELPMYVFMYLFLQYLHHDLWLAGLWWGKKELWMSLELFFPLPFETVLRYLFAALNIAPLHKV